MSREQDIIERLKLLSKGPKETFIATVEDNQPEEDSITVRDINGTLYPEVRKRAFLGPGTDGIIITPATGSTVLVSRISGSDEMFIEMFSEVDSIVIDGGHNGGFVITPKLIEQLQKVTVRIDGIIDALKNAKPTPQDGGAGLQTTIIAGLSKIMDKESFDNLENEKIKH